MASKSARRPFGVHPSVRLMQHWTESLKEKTGRSLDEWLALCERSGPKDEDGRRDWLKREHGLGTNAAAWIAARTFGKGEGDGDPEAYLRAAKGYVDGMFAGPKAALLPLFDKLLDVCHELGDDVRACPCQTIVPIYREHVIAQIVPATRTRIDFGLALGATKGNARLKETGGFAKKDRITHKIGIESEADIDATLRAWLAKAYAADAPKEPKKRAARDGS